MHVQLVVRMLVDCVEAADRLDERTNRLRHRGFGGDGHALCAVDAVVVHLRLERAAHVSRRAAESYEEAAGSDPIDPQPPRLDPGGDGFGVGVRDPEALADLRGREPVMVMGRSRILLIGEELLEGRLLLRGARENQCELA